MASIILKCHSTFFSVNSEYVPVYYSSFFSIKSIGNNFSEGDRFKNQYKNIPHMSICLQRLHCFDQHSNKIVEVKAKVVNEVYKYHPPRRNLKKNIKYYTYTQKI